MMLPEQNQRSRTVISSETVILGGLVFNGDLVVFGRVCGNVDGVAGSEANVVVSDHGVIEGEIRADRITVSGRVNGAVMASDRVDVLTTAEVAGDIFYGSIEIHLGAVVKGRLLRHEVETTGNVVILKSSGMTGD